MDWEKEAKKWERLAETHPAEKMKQDCLNHAKWCRAHLEQISSYQKPESDNDRR